MPKLSPARFDCPKCGAKYKLVKVEADPTQDPTQDREISCRSCGGPLDGREGIFALKYFMVERPRTQAEMRRAS
jgi:DNA-directed RNA polymerase subunit RPC12/RpoP